MVSLAEAIDLLIKNAAQLRAAGVSSLQGDGFAVTLTPFVAPDANDEKKPGSAGDVPGQKDPLFDEITFGGAVPGYTLDKD